MSYQTSTTGTTKSTSRVKVTKTIQRTTPDGKVVTETFTEYKEASDDADFTGFGRTNDPSSILQQTEHFTTSTQGKPEKLTQKTKGAVAKAESSSSSSDEEEERETFAGEALKTHNSYRKKHGIKSLKLSKKLCGYAQEWADKLAKEDRFEHRSNNEYGENLYCSWSSNPKAGITGSAPVDSWYSEISKHTFGEEPRSMGTSHFTQVVWKGSKELGIAKARSSSGKFIVVANYDPPGNFLGKYAENVPPPKE